jgi:hypothetical protein
MVKVCFREMMVDEQLELIDLNYLGTPETIPLYLI